MFKQLLTSGFCLLLAFSVQAQTITFPHTSAAIVADGNLDAAEWQQASSLKIPVNGADSVTVWYQYDNMAMHFAFMGKLESANALFPELLFDPQFVKSSSWMNGQWWFHVSATDCDNNGGYGVYTNCLGVQPDWQGAPNFTSGQPMTDTVEISIPFAKLGFTPAAGDTIGIAFLVTNTATIFKMYPGTSDRNNPSSWGTAVFAQATSVPAIPVKPLLQVSPNPGKGTFSFKSDEQIRHLEVFTIAGLKVYSSAPGSETAVVDLGHLAAGIYTWSVDLKTGKEQGKLIINK